jgi:hypothetical protein
VCACGGGGGRGGVEGKAESFQAPCFSGTFRVPRCEALVFVQVTHAFIKNLREIYLVQVTFT